MRISDCRSDVGSSDLIVANHVPAPREKLADRPAGDILTGLTRGRHALSGSVLAPSPTSSFGVPAIMADAQTTPAPPSSEVRSVGKEWVSTCISRWSPHN